MCIGSLVARIAAPGWLWVPVLLVLLVSELLVPKLLELELLVLELLVLELLVLELLVPKLLVLELLVLDCSSAVLQPSRHQVCFPHSFD